MNRSPLNRADIERLSKARNDLAAAAAAYDAAHSALAFALDDMRTASQAIDFFIGHTLLTKFRENNELTRKAFNGLGNFAPSVNASRVVEIADEALSAAWD